MEIETTRFGCIDLPDEALFRFPNGLYGFTDLRSFGLFAHDASGCFQWLQSTESPAVALVVTDPFRFYPEYEVEIPDTAAEVLGARAATDVEIYTTVTVTSEGAIFTNLLGPIAVNRRSRVGMQIIQDSNRYSARHPVHVPMPARGAEPAQAVAVEAG